jgi:hypothetical protein
MDLSAAPITLANLQPSLTILGNRPAFTEVEYRQFTHVLGSLIERRRVFGRVVSERPTNRPRVVGIGGFVEESFIERYLSSPHPEIGKQLLLREPNAILDENGIAVRNRSGGLQAVVVAQGFDITDAPPDGFEWVFGTGMNAFIEAHRGFRIERIVNVGFGESGVTAMASSGSWRMVGRFDNRYESGTVHTGVWTLTREEALGARNLLMPMFLYTPPAVCFTPTEQEILRAAVGDRTDAEIGRALGISVAATKARWNRIHLRFFARFPDDKRRLPSGTRGEQIRHVILEYVRTHPSELTPYARQAMPRVVSAS